MCRYIFIFGYLLGFGNCHSRVGAKENLPKAWACSGKIYLLGNGEMAGEGKVLCISIAALQANFFKKSPFGVL